MVRGSAAGSPARGPETAGSLPWQPRLSERFPPVDAVAARRRFSRAAQSYAKAARLETEAGTRMLERLDYVKIAPQRIVDAGSGPGRDARALAARYRGAQIVLVDFALPMLPRPGLLGRWLSAPLLSVGVHFARLPPPAPTPHLVRRTIAL